MVTCSKTLALQASFVMKISFCKFFQTFFKWVNYCFISIQSFRYFSILFRMLFFNLCHLWKHMWRFQSIKKCVWNFTKKRFIYVMGAEGHELNTELRDVLWNCNHRAVRLRHSLMNFEHFQVLKRIFRICYLLWICRKLKMCSHRK